MAKKKTAPGAAALWPGFRRRVRGQVAAWTRQERDPDGAPPEGSDRATLDRLLGVLTRRAETNSLEIREAAASARTRPARRTQTRRGTVR